MLPLPVLPALDILGRSLTAYEIRSGYDVDRRWLEGEKRPDFILTGVFSPADDKALQHLPEGDRSKGASVLHTTCRLPITDTSEKTGQEAKQVYICDGGEVWRVVKLQNWVANAGFYKYICVKHLNSKGHTKV